MKTIYRTWNTGLAATLAGLLFIAAVIAVASYIIYRFLKVGEKTQ